MFRLEVLRAFRLQDFRLGVKDSSFSIVRIGPFPTVRESHISFAADVWHLPVLTRACGYFRFLLSL